MVLYILHLSSGVLARADTNNVRKRVMDIDGSDLYIRVGMLSG